MPKIKTRRCAAMRFRIVGNGRIKCGKANKRHLLSNRTTKRKRQLRAPGVVPAGLERSIHRQIPYG